MTSSIPVTQEQVDELTVDGVVAFVPSAEGALPGVAGWVDWRLYSAISDARKRNRFSGARGEQLLISTARQTASGLRGLLSFPWILIVGTGPRREVDAELMRATATTVERLGWLRVAVEGVGDFSRQDFQPQKADCVWLVDAPPN